MNDCKIPNSSEPPSVSGTTVSGQPRDSQHITWKSADRAIPGKGKQDALVLPWIALRTAWLTKRNCDAHRICDFGAVAFPERSALYALS
jgi:hypothetical protein